MTSSHIFTVDLLENTDHFWGIFKVLLTSTISYQIWTKYTSPCHIQSMNIRNAVYMNILTAYFVKNNGNICSIYHQRFSYQIYLLQILPFGIFWVRYLTDIDRSWNRTFLMHILTFMEMPYLVKYEPNIYHGDKCCTRIQA